MRLRPTFLVVLAAVFAVFVPGWLATQSEPPAPLTHEAYVWQRVHDTGVQSAVIQHGRAFRQITVLAAEIAWPSHHSPPAVTRIDLDLPPPPVCPPLGLAVRIHSFRGSFAPDSPASIRVLSLARELISRTEAGGHSVRELQLDFDAAEAQLDDYRSWLDQLRPAIAPVRLSFTALPSWLDRPAFAPLAHAADSFVLQVHSLTLPSSPNNLPPLCDPAAASRAVRRAASAGTPFRLALPTYGYEVAFTPRGRFLGLAAEGSARAWPAASTLRTVRTDPGAIAGLVSTLKRQHPAALTGLAWYRLPVASDQLNWPWPTLAAVMDARVPATRLQLDAVPGPGDPSLIGLSLQNTGETDAFSIPLLSLDWTGARRIAADALLGFSIEEESNTRTRLAAPASFRLPPGASNLIGWFRFNHPPASLHATFLP